MNLTKIDNKWYISIKELKELGFDYPPEGTKGIYRTWLGGDNNWYKFHGKEDGWDGIWISDVIRRNVSDGEFFIEFGTNSFAYNCINNEEILKSEL